MGLQGNLFSEHPEPNWNYTPIHTYTLKHPLGCRVADITSISKPGGQEVYRIKIDFGYERRYNDQAGRAVNFSKLRIRPLFSVGVLIDQAGAFATAGTNPSNPRVASGNPGKIRLYSAASEADGAAPGQYIDLIIKPERTPGHKSQHLGTVFDADLRTPLTWPDSLVLQPHGFGDSLTSDNLPRGEVRLVAPKEDINCQAPITKTTVPGEEWMVDCEGHTLLLQRRAGHYLCVSASIGDLLDRGTLPPIPELTGLNPWDAVIAVREKGRAWDLVGPEPELFDEPAYRIEFEAGAYHIYDGYSYGVLSMQLLSLKRGDTLYVTNPGTSRPFFLPADWFKPGNEHLKGPLVLYANGTGYAPFELLLQKLYHYDFPYPVYLFHSIRYQMDELARGFIEPYEEKGVRYRKTLSGEGENPDGRKRYIPDALREDWDTFKALVRHRNVHFLGCGARGVVRQMILEVLRAQEALGRDGQPPECPLITLPTDLSVEEALSLPTRGRLMAKQAQRWRTLEAGGDEDRFQFETY